MKRELKFLNIPFEVKADSEKELIIEGHGAVKNNIDSYKDVIIDGAFKKTIEQMGDRIAFCYQHDIWNPIGKILEIREDEKGLFLKVKLSEAEGDIKTKIREGILKELSIGYSVISDEKGEKEGKEVNFLKEIKLYEVSLVTIAANAEAMIESMKQDGATNTDVITAEFDRIISIERNNNKKYELMKLKSLIIPQLVKDTIPEEPENNKSIGLTKEEVLTILKIN